MDTTGDMTVDAEGDATFGGNLTSGGDISIETGSVGTIAFEANVSSVNAVGDITLSNSAVSGTSVPTIATITSENGTGITFTAGDDFFMTAGEKMTTAGDLTIRTGTVAGNTGRAVLGDLVSLGDIRVTASDIDIISRNAGRVLTRNGSFVTDQGVDIIANGQFFFSVTPTMINGSRAVQFASPNADSDALGTLNGTWVVRRMPSSITVNDLIRGTTVLDLRAEGVDSLDSSQIAELAGALTPMSSMQPIVRFIPVDDEESTEEGEPVQEASTGNGSTSG